MKFNILKKVNGSGSTAPKNKFAYIAHINDIRSFPQADHKGVALTDDIMMKDKTGMSQIYITPAAQEYTYDTAGDSDSKSFKLKFVGTHPGTELEALEFAKNYLEEGFVVLIPSCEVGLKVLGTPDAPLVFTSSHKSDKDAQKFIFTFEQEIGTENVYQLYTGLVTLNENIDVDMGDFLEALKGYIKIDGSNLSEAQKQNLRTILGSDGKNLGNSDLSLNENRSFNLKTFFLNFFSNVGLAKVGINKNNPTQALDVVGNIKTDGLVIADGGTPDEVGSVKRNGNEIQFKTSTGWETIMLKGDYVSDSHGIISPSTPMPIGGWKVGWYTPKISSIAPGTNYPNQNDLKAVEGLLTEFYYDGSVWEDVYRVIDKALKLDQAGGALGYDRFLEMSSGDPMIVDEDLGSSVFNISGEYYGMDGFWGFHPAGIAIRTDYVFLKAGAKATIKAVSNNAQSVPLFVVFKEDLTTVLIRVSASSVNVVQERNYTATEDCYIVANCVSTTLLGNCKISREVLSFGQANKIISDANKKEFTDVNGGFLSYDIANSIFEFGNKLELKNNFDKNFAKFQQSYVINGNNELIFNSTDDKCFTLHNFVLGEVKAISIKGRLYDDRGGHRGFLGIKPDGTIEDIYSINGITTAWMQIDQTFDVSSYEKISLVIDNSVYIFSGKMFKASGLKSKTLENLKSQTLKQRILNGDSPIEVLGLQSQRQEVNLLKFKGKNLFYWSEGWDVSVIKVGDYDIETNTVSNATTIVSKEITGLTSPIFKCPTAFVVNQKVYLVVTAWQPNYCLMYESSDGKNFTLVSTTLANVAGFGGNFGNHWIVPQKIDNYYYWFIEGLNAPFGNWTMKLLRSQNITSGWELVGTVKGLNSGTGASGGACVHLQDGKFKMIYHYCPVQGSNIPTFIGYAEADVNDPLNFTQLYNPLTAIEHKQFGALTDQYADPELCEIDGRTFLFCSIVDNTTPRSAVYRWECDGRLSDILDSRI